MKKTLKWVVLPPEFIDETSHAPTGETLTEGMSHIVYDDWVDAQGDPKLQPAEVYSDSEYAAFVEFGTGPAKEKMDPSKGTLEDTIRRWALIKLPSAPPSEIDRLVNKVVKKVRVEGISPQPFLRSAVNTEMDMECGDNSTYMDDPHHSLLSMCEDIQILAEDNLINNGTVATGALVQSIEAEHIDPGLYNINYATGEVTLVVPDPNIPEIEDVWDDPKKGVKVKGVHKEAKKRR